MTSQTSQYQLSCQLDPPHQADVKAVLAISDSLIATASRDTSVGIWARSGSSKFTLTALLSGHNAYVNSLAYIPSDDEDVDDLIASGGNSTLILLHSLKTLATESTECLIGHALNVCTLTYSPRSKLLMSGSWDCTAKIWSKRSGIWEARLTLEGHQAAVWGVAIVDQGPREGCYLTGSADRLIDVWDRHGNLLNRLKGSPGPVRSLTMLPDMDTFASACNDNLIRVWTFEGSVIATLAGHQDYIYQLAMEGKDHLLLSCGEDHSVRIWKDCQEVASLLHPCQTVWSVSALPNGDVITGGSDGRVRIWSKAESRFATEEIRGSYESEVSAATTSPQMPDEQAIISEETDVTVEIDLSDDEPRIPLVFRAGSNLRAVAEEFGQQHSLSDNYVNQIEAYIRTVLRSRGIDDHYD